MHETHQQKPVVGVECGRPVKVVMNGGLHRHLVRAAMLSLVRMNAQPMLYRPWQAGK